MGAITHTPKLLTTHTLIFYRTTPPELTLGGNYTGGSTLPLPEITGSLQPIRGGLRVRIIPDGYDTESGYFFFTQSVLQGYQEGIGQIPDYAIIDGRQYEVHNTEDWAGFGLNTDHNKYILIARAQPPEVIP